MVRMLFSAETHFQHVETPRSTTFRGWVAMGRSMFRALGRFFWSSAQRASDSKKPPRVPFGCGAKICTQNGALVSGNMDQNLRSPGSLILPHTLLKKNERLVQSSCFGTFAFFVGLVAPKGNERHHLEPFPEFETPKSVSTSQKSPSEHFLSAKIRTTNIWTRRGRTPMSENWNAPDTTKHIGVSFKTLVI